MSDYWDVLRDEAQRDYDNGNWNLGFYFYG